MRLAGEKNNERQDERYKRRTLVNGRKRDDVDGACGGCLGGEERLKGGWTGGEFDGILITVVRLNTW